MTIAIHRIVKRIRLLDKEITYSIDAGLNSPITVKGPDELFESFMLDSRDEIRLIGPELVSSAIGDNLSGMILMLHEDHFKTDVTRLVFPKARILFDPTFISRITANIFSNIEKYASPDSAIFISSEMDDENIRFSFSNRIAYRETSNHGAGIGTRNIQNMMRLMHGSSREKIDLNEMIYCITLTFPVADDENVSARRERG